MASSDVFFSLLEAEEISKKVSLVYLPPFYVCKMLTINNLSTSPHTVTPASTFVYEDSSSPTP